MRHIQFLAAFLFLMASGCGNNNENKNNFVTSVTEYNWISIYNKIKGKQNKLI